MDRPQKSREGREAAFLDTFESHHVPLFRFAYRLTGSLADAEDIVQECFLDLLRPGCSYDSARTPIRVYLFGAVRNQAFKRLRKRNSAEPGEPEAAHYPSPESEYLRGEMEDIVANAVGDLPDAQRDVLILAPYEQIPMAEVARIMDLGLGAVKSRLQRARNALKLTLEAYGSGVERKL
jgi:RNA polymerase sigma-70 factor (ECF subfamily)